MISQRRTLWRRLEWCRCWTTSSCIATEATRGAASLRGRAVMVSETISCDCPVSGSLLWKAFCAKALTRSWRRARVAGTRTADLHAVTVVRRFEAFGPISRDSGPGRSLGRGSGGKHRKYRDSCNHFHPDNSQHSSAPSAPMPMLAKLRGGKSSQWLLRATLEYNSRPSAGLPMANLPSASSNGAEPRLTRTNHASPEAADLRPTYDLAAKLARRSCSVTISVIGESGDCVIPIAT
jgi:hypothetical protein